MSPPTARAADPSPARTTDGSPELKILAFDTATRATSVALALSESQPPLEARDDPPAGERPRHTTRLLPLIAQLLEDAQISFAELERIAVGVGPGTFTGLRIGIATARALAQACSLPLVGVSTLHALAVGADDAACNWEEIDTVLALLDARRGEVFAAAWPVATRERAPLVTARALQPDALAALLESSEGIEPARTLAVGDGALAFRPVVARSGVLIPDDDSQLHRVSAANHCRLARSLIPRQPEDVQPCYLRAPDAEPIREIIVSSP